ncbi:hypothetical protein C8R47DRAFT_1170867 [Mycena vitilis]|nr:hypothetical protein C8R47DRAFT_1170867 [Mycena vitilis]
MLDGCGGDQTMVVNGGVGGAGGPAKGTGGVGGAGGTGEGPRLYVEAVENLSVDVQGDLNLSARYDAQYQLSSPIRSLLGHTTVPAAANDICRPSFLREFSHPEKHCACISQCRSTGYRDMFRAVSGYRAGDSAGPSHARPVYGRSSSFSESARQSVQTAQRVSGLSSTSYSTGPPWGDVPYGPRSSINVKGNVNNIQRQAESGLNILHGAVAGGAFHNSLERYPQPRCHPETRTEMLDDLHKWSSQTDVGSSILWLHGPAGAGKSAIAQSFCQILEEEGRLGAGFFFKRGHASRGSGNKLFPTIVYQLARSCPNLKQEISAIVEDDPAIIARDFSTQVHRLMVEPCVRCTTRNLVIVIDGLDECEGQNVQREILCSLGTIVHKQPLLFRILVASRPEPHIQDVFRGALNKIYRPLNINQSFEDVKTYLADEFGRIHREHWETMATVAEPWPTLDVIEKLADTSSGYFVFASMVIRFIDDRDFRPTERLDVIMDINPVGSEAPFAALDQLYIRILSDVPVSSRPQLVKVLTILVAKFNLSLLHIEQLLELQSGDCLLILRHLHSVVDVPQNTGERMTAHHASFLEFLDKPKRSETFCISELQRANLARHILKALSLNIAPSSDHVVWQIDQVEFEYVTSIPPSPDLVSMLYSLNTDFLVFPNVHHVVHKVLGWLRRCRPLPHILVKLWEDYETIVTGVRSPSRLRLESESIEGELELHRRSPQPSTQLARIMFSKVRQLLDSEDFGCLEAANIAAESLAGMDTSTVEDLASFLYDFGSLRGSARRTLNFNKEAVQVYRKLAEIEPAPATYKNLASSLHNLAVDLHMTGQYDAAVCAEHETVEIRRKLVETDPSVVKNLASSLHNLGTDLRSVERHYDAVRAHEEAVQLRRKLAEVDPSIDKDLVWSLENLAFKLCTVGRHKDAVHAKEDVVQLRRKLAGTECSVSEDLAASLYSLGYSFRVVGRHQDALSADAEAVDIRRRLVGNNPSALAQSLENLALNLNAVGRPGDAASVAEEAVQHYSQLPDIAESERRLANILVQGATYLRSLGCPEDSARMHEEGAELHRKLSETDPESTADLLRELAGDFSTTGLHQDSLSAADKSIELYHRLTAAKPALAKKLIKSLGYRAESLHALGHDEDAMRSESEIVALRGAQKDAPVPADPVESQKYVAKPEKSERD